MLEIKIAVKVEGLDKLADALLAIVGMGAKNENAITTVDTSMVQTAEQTAESDLPETTTMQTAPTAVQAFGTSSSAMQTVQTVQTAQAAVPVVASTPPASPAESVPVNVPSYSRDDLTRAAMMLMDAGKQADLKALLARFGVESLPLLPPECYGAFATGMREMGAQI